MVIPKGLSIGTKDRKTFSFVNQRKRTFFFQRKKKPLEDYLNHYRQVVSTTRNQKSSLIVRAGISLTQQMLAHLLVHTKPKVLFKIE